MIRLRDQIKVWLATPEVKDKPPLEEARKKIEKVRKLARLLLSLYALSASLASFESIAA